MESRDQEKKEKLLAALDLGMVMIHLDARRPGVSVPPSLAEEAHLRLNLSYRFDPPDLSVTSWGIRSTLSFGGQRQLVAVPWSALFAVTSYVSREFWMFPDDMPQELLQSVASRTDGAQRSPEAGTGTAPDSAQGQTATAARDNPAQRPGRPARPVLQQVRGGLDDVPPPQAPEEETPAAEGEPLAAEGEDVPPEPPPKARSRSHLRLLK